MRRATLTKVQISFPQDLTEIKNISIHLVFKWNKNTIFLIKLIKLKLILYFQKTLKLEQHCDKQKGELKA